jgi:signal transduction histidine kinase
MAELRQVMGLLTPSEGEADDLAPQPGLDQLPALVDRVRGTGMPVDYTVTGTPKPLPQGVDLAAYRVVQEALTNTVKHAVGASARVCVEFADEALRITVTDVGGRPGANAATGNGRGLLGLRERLAVYRGSLDAGPHRDGFRVRATIPVTA